MPELRFHFEGAEAMAHAAVPLIALKLVVANVPEDEVIHSILLRCQVQIEPTKRRYAKGEQEPLRDLFGEPERWSRTVRPLHWMNTSVVVPEFMREARVDIELPCTFDFNLAATKYFHALQAGEIPLLVMFSGTAFYPSHDGSLQVAPIPWDREATYRLPVSVWKEMIEAYYPNSAWLRLNREAFNALNDYKIRNGLTSFEQAITRALQSERTEVEV